MSPWFFKAWTATGALLLLLSGTATGSEPFLQFFVLAAWLAWGLQVWAMLLLSGQEGRTPVQKASALLAPPAVVLLGWLLLWPAQRWSSVLWAHLELRGNRSTYEQIIEQAGAGDPTPEEVVLDEGSPQRVAFRWGAGLIDNWRAIVHDPTGLVLEANGSGGAEYDSAAGRARLLFGGELFRVIHLSGPYYLCWFT